MSKIIEIDPDMESLIKEFCIDELTYHLFQSGCPDEYTGETEAEIFLLRSLGEEEPFLENMADLCLYTLNNTSSYDDPLNNSNEKRFREIEAYVAVLKALDRDKEVAEYERRLEEIYEKEKEGIV